MAGLNRQSWAIAYYDAARYGMVMMVADRKTTTGEPLRLTAQITHIENRILERQHLIRRYTASCEQGLRHSTASPRTLLWAGGAGLLIGMLTRRHSSAPHKRVDVGARAGTLFDSVLQSIVLIRTLFPTRRLAAIWPFR
jgi:hypothetical protein